MHRIEQLLEHAPPHIKGRIVADHIILDIVGEDVHYWSPQLNFRVEEDEEHTNQSKVSGLIGPNPTVWTLFTFIYFSVGIIGFFASSYGVSHLLMGEYSHFILAFPLAILFMLTAYRVGKYGEKLASEQVEMLKDFVRKAVSKDDLPVSEKE